MAKADNNLILRNISGMIGGQIVVRRGRNGTYVVAAAPRRCTRQSEAQRAQRERFRRAAQFAKNAQRLPWYVELGKARNQTAYVAAIRDFLSNPEVQHYRDTSLELAEQVPNTVANQAHITVAVGVAVDTTVVAANGALMHQGVHAPASNALTGCVGIVGQTRCTTSAAVEQRVGLEELVSGGAVEGSAGVVAHDHNADGHAAATAVAGVAAITLAGIFAASQIQPRACG